MNEDDIPQHLREAFEELKRTATASQLLQMLIGRRALPDERLETLAPIIDRVLFTKSQVEKAVQLSLAMHLAEMQDGGRVNRHRQPDETARHVSPDDFRKGFEIIDSQGHKLYRVTELPDSPGAPPIKRYLSAPNLNDVHDMLDARADSFRRRDAHDSWQVPPDFKIARCGVHNGWGIERLFIDTRSRTS